SAVDVDHDRRGFSGFERGGPDIEGEAVFAHVAAGNAERGAGLIADGSIAGGVADAGPGRGRLRLAPAEIADGRSGVGDSPEEEDRGIRLGGDSGEIALGY